MILELKLNQEKFIQKQLESGKFDSTEQLIDLAFSLLETIGDDYLQWLEETRNKVDIAISELEDGQGLDGETVIQNILTKFKQVQE